MTPKNFGGSNQRHVGGQSRHDPQQFADRPTDDELRKILLDGDINLLVTKSEAIGKYLGSVEKLSTSQLRNVFGSIRQIQMRWKSDPQRAWDQMVLLRPKMAYYAKRALKGQDKSKGLETLREILDRAIIMLGKNGKPSDEQFNRLVDFCEAIVAYHTQYESSKGGQNE